MNDEFIPDDADFQDEPLELYIDDADEDVEYEEVSSEEVDRVVGLLEDLMETVDSENIRIFLEDAVSSIYYLVYEPEEDDADSGMSSEAA